MSLANAGNLGQNQLLNHLIQDGPYNVQFLEVWPMFGVDGKQLDVAYTRQFSTPTAEIIEACGTLEERTRSPEVTNKQFGIPVIQTRYDICWSDADSIEVPMELYAEQDALSLQGLLYEYARLLDVGGIGFPALSTLTSQVVNLAGAAPTVEDFNRTLLRVATNNGFDVIVMGNLHALNTYWSICAERGIDAWMWQQNVPGNMGGRVSRPHAFVQHARWYVNEMIPNRVVNDVTVTNVYFMQLGYNPDFGTAKGVFGIIPKPRVGNMFFRRQLQGRWNGAAMETTESVFWSFPAGVAVAADRSLSVLKDMQVAPF